MPDTANTRDPKLRPSTGTLFCQFLLQPPFRRCPRGFIFPNSVMRFTAFPTANAVSCTDLTTPVTRTMHDIPRYACNISNCSLFLLFHPILQMHGFYWQTRHFYRLKNTASHRYLQSEELVTLLCVRTIPTRCHFCHNEIMCRSSKLQIT